MKKFHLTISILFFSIKYIVGQNNIEFADTIKPLINSGNVTIEKYISENTKYPELASMECQRGKVNISFTVTSSGNLQNITILKNSFYLLDIEAINVIRSTQGKWTPASVNGIPIDYYITHEFNFWFDDLKCDQYAFDNSLAFYLAEKRERLRLIYERGVGQLMVKNYKDALVDFTEIIEFNNMDTDALYNSGLCKLKLGDIEGACQDWKRSKKYSENNKDKEEINGLLEEFCK